MREVKARLATGVIAPHFPALSDARHIGIGQSMGGCVTILAQGRHQTFDAIAPLGYSAIHTTLPQRSAEATESTKAVFADVKLGKAERSSSHYVANDYAYAFHLEDVPAQIVAADFAGGCPQRATSPRFGSMTIPWCAVQMMTPRAVAPEAAAITVPIFIGNGARDVCPDPHAEPSAYRASADITLVIIPDVAHMHNFGSSRVQLWDRLAAWYGH